MVRRFPEGKRDREKKVSRTQFQEPEDFKKIGKQKAISRIKGYFQKIGKQKAISRTTPLRSDLVFPHDSVLPHVHIGRFSI